MRLGRWPYYLHPSFAGGLNNHIQLLEHHLAPNMCCISVSVTIITIVIEGDTVEG